MADTDLSYEFRWLGEKIYRTGEAPDFSYTVVPPGGTVPLPISGTIRTDASGFFSITQNFSATGAWLFSFTDPVLNDLTPRVITIRPELGPSGKAFHLVSFDWNSDPGVQGLLMSIARETLNIGDIRHGDLILAEYFKVETERIFERDYDGLRIDLTDSPTSTTRIITVRTSCPEFEWSLGHCPFGSSSFMLSGDYSKAANIFPSHVRSFITEMIDVEHYFNRSEPPIERIYDVGRMMGNTAAHEVGHSFGLVPENLFGTVHGTTNHNAFFGPEEIVSLRFANGWFIMDGGNRRGPSSLGNRFEDASDEKRSDRPVGSPVIRRPILFNEINRQYLEVTQ